MRRLLNYWDDPVNLVERAGLHIPLSESAGNQESMTNQSRARLIALDWGTSSLRAYLLGDAGIVLSARRQNSGVLALTSEANRAGINHAQAFEHCFEALCGDWLTLWPDVPVIACGMVGSNQGWVETPYRKLPSDLATGGILTSVPTKRHSMVHIIPGLIVDSDLPDVIRGEETQVLGALMSGPQTNPHQSDERIVLLPGTHSKWVRVSGTTVTAFTTYMTGEFFSLLATKSTLSLQTVRSQAPDWEAFARGLEVAAAPNGGILMTAFLARTLVMTGKLHPTQVEDYLSGLLIGAEIAGIRALWFGEFSGEILLCGEPDLNDRYRHALKRFGLQVAHETTTAAVAGMWHAATEAGLLSESGTQPIQQHPSMSKG
jgi:2-dehydro-3-deoxygalactonokinase